MKKKVGTFKIWLLAIAAVVAFSVLPKVSSLATEDQALVVKENMQEAADAAGDESSAENKLETAGEASRFAPSPAVSCLFSADDSSPAASAASCIFYFTTSA